MRAESDAQGGVGHAAVHAVSQASGQAASQPASQAAKHAARHPANHAALTKFNALYGGDADGLWAAPGRVNLIGEHCDYNAGLCLPFAITKRTFVAAGRNAAGVVRVSSGSIRTDKKIVEVCLHELARLYGGGVTGSKPESEPRSKTRGETGSQHSGRSGVQAAEALPTWANYPLGVAWALLQHVETERLAFLPGVDMFFESEVPLGAGLSSSAAIECATAIALNDIWQLGLSKMQLAKACQRAENVAAGAPTGIMDQLASLFGTPGSAVLLDCRDFSVTNIPLDFEAHGLALLVIDTGVHHSNSDGGFAARREECEAAARHFGVSALREVTVTQIHADESGADLANEGDFAAPLKMLRRAKHVVSEIARVQQTVLLLEKGLMKEMGQILNASHASLRDDFDVSCAELNLAVEAAIEAGALGARMVGAGFGGSAIALIQKPLAKAVIENITRAFTEQGHKKPKFFKAVPGLGAARVL